MTFLLTSEDVANLIISKGVGVLFEDMWQKGVFKILFQETTSKA